jgi:hypothetical protein
LINGRVSPPQTQGQVERLDKSITRAIARQINANGDDVKEACWIKFIKKVIHD